MPVFAKSLENVNGDSDSGKRKSPAPLPAAPPRTKEKNGIFRYILK